MKTPNEGNTTGQLGTFINESYKLQLSGLNWIRSPTAPISVMLITAADGHLITHKWEQNQTRGEQKRHGMASCPVSHWVSPVFKHKKCQGWSLCASKNCYYAKTCFFFPNVAHGEQLGGMSKLLTTLFCQVGRLATPTCSGCKGERCG